MQIDPVQEWQRLTAAYREKSPEELRELARDLADLTDTAQQALRSEMRSRGMGDPEAPPEKTIARQQSPPREKEDRFDNPDSDVFFYSMPKIVDDDDDIQEDAASRDYSWFTYLCECETRQQALELCEVLQRANIDNRYRTHGLSYPQVYVAADQLEEARLIAEKPIPQDIVDDLKVEVPEYEVPKCPKCGTEDPLLESVEPTNHWHCENCDAEWDDPPASTGGVAEKIAN